VALYKITDFWKRDKFQLRTVLLLEHVNHATEFVSKLFNDRHPFNSLSESDYTNKIARLRDVTNSRPNVLVPIVGIILEPRALLTTYYKQGSLASGLCQEDAEREGAPSPRQGLPLARRLSYAVDCCEAVSHLHKHGVAHANLSIRELMLSDDRQHVLLDLDVTTLRLRPREEEEEKIPETRVTKRESQRSLKGPRTPKDPESLDGCFDGCLAEDVYHLGLTLWEILNVRVHPLDGGPPKRLAAPGQGGLDGFTEDQEAELWDILRSCYHRDPGLRPPCESILRCVKRFQRKLQEADYQRRPVLPETRSPPKTRAGLQRDRIHSEEGKLDEPMSPVSDASLPPGVSRTSSFEHVGEVELEVLRPTEPRVQVVTLEERGGIAGGGHEEAKDDPPATLRDRSPESQEKLESRERSPGSSVVELEQSPRRGSAARPKEVDLTLPLGKCPKKTQVARSPRGTSVESVGETKLSRCVDSDGTAELSPANETEV